MELIKLLRELKDVSFLLYVKTKEKKYLQMFKVTGDLLRIEEEKCTDVC